MSEQYTDILIIGGGLVGFALAAALKNTGITVTIIEAKPAATSVSASSNSSTYSAQAATDPRAIALAMPSVNLLKTIGAWTETLTAHAQPITNIRISQQGSFGKAHLRANAHHLPAFGYVVPAHSLQDALVSAVPPAMCQVLQPVTVTDCIQTNDGQVLCHLSDGQIWRAQLIIAADGVRSSWREKLQLAAQTTDYDNAAIVANLTLDRNHDGVANERFTKDGLMALLPLPQKQVGLVWSVPKQRAQALQQSSASEFLQAIQSQFGLSLGRFIAVEQCTSFPLTKINLRQPWVANMVFLGSAAHHLHPVAGQGLNLSLRDVAALAELLGDAKMANQPLASKSLLQSFQDSRQDDWQQVNFGTHNLVKLFQSQHAGAKILRSIGLAIFDKLPLCQRYVCDKASGLNGLLPSLCCGAPLPTKGSQL